MYCRFNGKLYNALYIQPIEVKNVIRFTKSGDRGVLSVPFSRTLLLFILFLHG